MGVEIYYDIHARADRPAERVRLTLVWPRTQLRDGVVRSSPLRCKCRRRMTERSSRQAGVSYWENRGLTELNSQINAWNGVIAAIAGAVNDVARDCGDGEVQSPIFANPDSNAWSWRVSSRFALLPRINPAIRLKAVSELRGWFQTARG